MTESAPRRARDRARAELIAEITATARDHLGRYGAGGLSLRAISRDLGMVSSALYRYFPSRDALLTRLIIDSYNALGDACERAEAAIDRDDLHGRLRAMWSAAHEWARRNPHEYALIYGSPVPGYAAPEDTIDPAIRVTRLFVELAADVDPSGLRLDAPGPIASPLREQLARISSQVGREIDERVLLVGIAIWSQLFGMISFELFGTFRNVFDDADALYEHQLQLGAAALGIPAPGSGPGA